MNEPDPTVLLYALPAFLVCFCAFVAVVARLEKRMVWPYGEPQPQQQFGDIAGYGARWVGDGLRAGFTFFGWAPDLKGPRYRVCYGFLISPERDCLAIIGVGTILNMKLCGTWLYSRTVDGRVFYTTDHQSCVEIDVSRKWKCQLSLQKSLPALLERHREMLRSRRVTALPYSPGRELAEFRTAREEHYRTMARTGLIAFTNASCTHWRYTGLGALKWAALSYSIGIVRAVTAGRVPRVA